MNPCRKPYPSDVSKEGFAPYLVLQRDDAGQREHDLRAVFNGLRSIVKTGAPWRWMRGDLPPWAAVYQQMQRWLAAGRQTEPSAAILGSRTLRSTPESGERGAYDRAAMTGPSARRAPRCIGRWTRWVTGSPCTSRLRARRIGVRWTPRAEGMERPPLSTAPTAKERRIRAVASFTSPSPSRIVSSRCGMVTATRTTPMSGRQHSVSSRVDPVLVVRSRASASEWLLLGGSRSATLRGEPVDDSARAKARSLVERDEQDGLCA